MSDPTRVSTIVSPLRIRFMRQQLLHALFFMGCCATVILLATGWQDGGDREFLTISSLVMAFCLGYGTLHNAIRNRVLEDILMLPGSLPAVLWAMVSAAFATTWIASLFPSILVAGSLESLRLYQVGLIAHASIAAAMGVSMALPLPGSRWRWMWVVFVRGGVLALWTLVAIESGARPTGWVLVSLLWSTASMIFLSVWAWWVASGPDLMLEPTVQRAGRCEKYPMPSVRRSPVPAFLSPVLWYGVRRHARGALWLGVLASLLVFPLGPPVELVFNAFIPSAILTLWFSARQAFESRRDGVYEDLAITPLENTWVSIAEIGALSVLALLFIFPSAAVSLNVYFWIYPMWAHQLDRFDAILALGAMLFTMLELAVLCGHTLGKRFAHYGEACLAGVFIWLFLSSLVIGQVLLVCAVTERLLGSLVSSGVLAGTIPLVCAFMVYSAAAVKPARVPRPT